MKNIKFAERLKQLREDADLTQTDLAKAVNVTQRNISFYEKGVNEPSLDTLINLAKYFKVTTDYLLGINDINVQPRESK